MKVNGYGLKPIEEAMENFKSNNVRFIRNCYQCICPKFVSWFRRNYYLDEGESKELYQRAFTIFYDNMKNKLIPDTSGSVESYLFGVGKNLAKEIARVKKRDSHSHTSKEIELMECEQEKKDEINYREALVKDLLGRIDCPCKSILSMYYLQNFSMESIANNMGYKNEKVVKQKKCQCLKKIRKQIAILGINIRGI